MLIDHFQQSQSAQPPTNGEMKRHHSTDSMYSVSSTSTSCSNQDKLTKKKSGFRHSLQRAFSRSQKGPKASRPVSQSSNPDPDFMLMNYPSHEDVCISPQPYVPPLSPTKISPPNSASPIQNGNCNIPITSELFQETSIPIFRRATDHVRPGRQSGSHPPCETTARKGPRPDRYPIGGSHDRLSSRKSQRNGHENAPGDDVPQA